MSTIPILDLHHTLSPNLKPDLLTQLRDALFNIGFLYIKNHDIPPETISNLTNLVPSLFDLPDSSKQRLSKIHSPHFLGYSGFAEETTLGRRDLREQFDFGTELGVIYKEEEGGGGEGEGDGGRDFSKLYWRLRGPNLWPTEEEMPGFREALTNYHDALSALSYRFVHLVEEAFGIPIGTFDIFFGSSSLTSPIANYTFLPPQHRLKIVKYPNPTQKNNDIQGQGVGAHKDSSGWLTFLYQLNSEPGLEVLSNDGTTWIPANPIPNTFVVNFGNAFEAATEGAVRATIHRVIAPRERDRYSIPFFMGLPLDLTVSGVREVIPERVREMRRMVEEGDGEVVATFLDPRWDSLGESQLRKWIRSHRDVAERWYSDETVEYYTQ